MPRSDTPGQRLRAARLDRGIGQADLARQAGISASYLNLIEHDRRRIAGRLMQDLARLLDLDPALLVEGQGSPLAQRLEAAARGVPGGHHPEGAGGFAARYPGWAGVVARQADRIEALETRVEALSDRLAHDPEMAGALHDLISAVTSVQSTASILVESGGLDADWQARFHRNLNADAQRLAARTQTLVEGLEAASRAPVRGPREQMEAFFATRGYHFARIEAGGSPEAELAGVEALESPGARTMTLAWLRRYAADAEALPLDRFSHMARRMDYAALPLAIQLEVPLERVMRRLAALPEGQGHPAFGLAVCDGAGGILFRKPVEGVALARGGGACPLWPLFGALARPGQPIEVDLALPGAVAPALRAVAVAVPRGAGSAEAVPQMESTMILRPTIGKTLLPVGPGCRVCPRTGCAARREPQISDGAE